MKTTFLSDRGLATWCRVILGFGMVVCSVVGRVELKAAPMPQVVPMVQAHSHNDYEHARPLLDALDQGFGSVEADIFLVDGQLLVAHYRNQVKPDRTLESLYLAPLAERVRINRGSVYRGASRFRFVLMIDVKEQAEATYAVLKPQLEKYRFMLTRFEGDKIRPGAVTIVLSGDRPRKVMEGEKERLCALDGRWEDLDLKPSPSPSLVYWVSGNWKTDFKWNGEGAFPESEREKLKALVKKAHGQGRKIRFWGTPDRAEMWAAQKEAGVDVLNADDLQGLRQFLQKK